MANKNKKIKNKQISGASSISVPKKISIILLALLFLICVVINGWYFYVKFYAKQKIVSNTSEVGLQTIEDGTTKYFAEVLLNKNETGDGLKTFEIKYNYLVDETKTMFYSQGQQFTSDSDLKLGYYQTDVKTTNVGEGKWYLRTKQIAYYSQVATGSDTEYFNYASADDYDTTIDSSNPIGEDTRFKIELGSEIYLMEFKNEYRETWRSDTFYDFKLYTGYYYYNAYFYLIDHMYFASLLYDSVSILKAGTNQSVLFEFGDLFNYYRYNAESQQYLLINEADSEKVIQDVKSYYSIKVTINSNGAKKASTDSLFKCINGNANYNSTGDYSSTDYFIGRTIINCDINNFDFVETDTLNTFKLSLKESFKNYYLQFKDTIQLQVKINLDEFNESGINFDGFTSSCFSGFNVYKIFTTETIDREVITEEVTI